MENKKTTELLDLLWTLESAPEDKQNWEKHSEAMDELIKRPPFNRILGENVFGSENVGDMTIEERTTILLDDMKLIKRHKHDEKTGDVMVRI